VALVIIFGYTGELPITSARVQTLAEDLKEQYKLLRELWKM